MLSTKGTHSTRHHAAAWIVSLCACALLLASTPVLAQQYPAKPVRVINPFPAGGGLDITGRLLASLLSQALGQQFVVENRPGATGIIGSAVVARSAPDGYTLLLVANSHATNPSLYSKLPYDSERDFAPVTLFSISNYVLVVHPSLQVYSVRDLIAFAKRNPGQLNFASSGNATLTHLAGELLKLMAGIDLSHIPYKGSSESATATIGGYVPILFIPTSVVLPFVQAGKLRALGVTGANRLPVLPDVPMIAEAGLPGFEVAGWSGLSGPAGISKEIITLLSAHTTKAMQAPEVVKRFASVGATPVGSTPEAFASVIHDDIAKWARVIRMTGVKID